MCFDNCELVVCVIGFCFLTLGFVSVFLVMCFGSVWYLLTWT